LARLNLLLYHGVLAPRGAVTLCILSSNTWNLEGVPIAAVISWATMATLHHVLCGGANGVGVEHCRIKLPGGTRHHLGGFEEATRDELANHPRLLEFPKSLARLECALGELAC
jgi:hypothetical protein